ncbi:MAG: 50S ribosomal protein L22 [Bacteroidota bacterium]
MQVYAKLNKLNISPRKSRLVVDLIRGKTVERALNLLQFETKRASLPIKKLVYSAVANWKQNKENEKLGEENELYIKEVYVGSAGMLKRIKPAPQGRAHRIRKRLSHITLCVDLKSKKSLTNHTAKA